MFFAIIILILLVCLFLIYPIFFVDFSNKKKKTYPFLGIKEKMQSSINYNNHIWMEGNTIYGKIKLVKDNNQEVDTVVKLYRFVPVVGSSDPAILQKDYFLSNSSDTLYYKTGLNVESFLIGTTEVPEIFWEIFSKNKFRNEEFGALCWIPPQSKLKYEQCISFVKKLSDILDRDFRLPTFHEWRFAASGGVKSKGFIYSGSNDITKVAWYKGNVQGGNGNLSGIASKMPNELGIYDMSGNIAEFTSTLYGDFYSEVGLGNINTVISHNNIKIQKPLVVGGSVNDDPDKCRIDLFPTEITTSAGFRIIMEP